jgi:hypothetical protein
VASAIFDAFLGRGSEAVVATGTDRFVLEYDTAYSAGMESDFKDEFELMPNSNPVQLYYYMLKEELKYDPVFKRRQHDFIKEGSENMALQLANGLYLSQLAYNQ